MLKLIKLTGARITKPFVLTLILLICICTMVVYDDTLRASEPGNVELLPIDMSHGVDTAMLGNDDTRLSKAHKVMYGLKTGADVMWREVLLHQATTFKLWPQHGVYAEISEVIGNETIIDIFERLPDSILNDGALDKYRILKQGVLRKDGREVDSVIDYDGWWIDRFKNVPMAAHMWEHATPDTEWFIFADGDTVLMQDAVLDFLKDYDPEQPWLFGRKANAYAFTPDGDLTDIHFPHGGSGVITSRGALEKLFIAGVQPVIDDYSGRAIYHCCGDAIFGIAMYEVANVSMSVHPKTTSGYADLFQGNNFAQFGIVSDSWCHPILTFHHLTPREIERLYEFQAQAIGEISQSTFYDNFMLPFIVPEKQWWDAFESMNGDEKEGWLYEFTEDNKSHRDDIDDLLTERETLPYDNKDLCRDLCEKVEDCMVWRWRDGSCTISHGELLVRGRSVREGYKNWQDEEVWSGWVVERITNRRYEWGCSTAMHDRPEGWARIE